MKAVKQDLKIQDQERLTLQKNNENFTSSIPSTSEIQNHKKEKETA